MARLKIKRVSALCDKIYNSKCLQLKTVENKSKIFYVEKKYSIKHLHSKQLKQILSRATKPTDTMCAYVCARDFARVYVYARMCVRIRSCVSVYVLLLLLIYIYI